MINFESLYLHVPFCQGKCAYCTFYSEARHTAEQHAAFLLRLDQELAGAAAGLQNLQTIFIGGGSPTALPPDAFHHLLQIVHQHCQWRPGAEFTIECNPELLTREQIGIIAEAGVNRVSLGVQSFNPELRRVIGRAGSTDRLPSLLEQLVKAHIHNLGIDLIYAIPGQTMEDWEADMRLAMRSPATHLSTYELTIEEGTRLARDQAITRFDQELTEKMWEKTEQICRETDFQRYEVSNLARPNFACRHNDAVWHGASYLGCGPAACSFDGSRRWSNPASLKQWLEHEPESADWLTASERAVEILAFGLRTIRGWNQDEFQQRTGFELWQLRGPQLTGLIEQGLLTTTTDQCIRPTRKGILFADEIAVRLL